MQPTRIILETDRADENCGATADRLLECLPWTPLTALGCNFTYRGTVDDIEDWCAKTAFPPSRIPSETTLKQRTWHLALELNERVFNLQMCQVEDYVEIRANVHVDLDAQKNEFARATAQQFFPLRETAETFIRDLFNAGIDDAILDR